MLSGGAIRAILQAQQSAEGIISGEGIDVDVIKSLRLNMKNWWFWSGSNVPKIRYWNVMISRLNWKDGVDTWPWRDSDPKGLPYLRDCRAGIEKTSSWNKSWPKTPSIPFGSIALYKWFYNSGRLDKCLKLQKELQDKVSTLESARYEVEKGYMSRSQVRQS